jgi:hypothetical protein
MDRDTQASKKVMNQSQHQIDVYTDSLPPFPFQRKSHFLWKFIFSLIAAQICK